MLMDIIYWGIFALTVIGFVAWVVLGMLGCDPLGYTRASTESLPTRKDGKP
jgi:hypothetical protein